MLEFFRKYQRYFFFAITVVVIASFTFFGTGSSLGGEPERKDRVIGRAINGSSIMLSEIQKISRFIATDREDLAQGRGLVPNLCNDGVIRYDFLKVGLADLLVKEYFDSLRGDFTSRLEKAKRFRSYAHPEASFLSAKAVWDRLLPSMNEEIEGLQKESQVSLRLFSRLGKLYEYQSKLQPETLRRILIYQHQQYPWLSIDQRLSYDDMALFGFHTASDWFGHNFVDIISQFILNAAGKAEEKGYKVSLEEAKGDLLHHFAQSIEKMGETKPDFNFHQHLRMLGFDERSAAEVWRKVLLFRSYFKDVGESAFVDRLPYKDFANYVNESAIVKAYEWPKALQLRTAQDLAELQFYLKAVTKKTKEALPTEYLSVQEVETKFPELVQTTYRAQVAEVSKQQIALKPSLKDVWDWQLQDAHWAQLKKEFSLPEAVSRDERFKVLEKLDPKIRLQIDAFARDCLVDENPAWIDEALAAASVKEKTWAVAANQDPILKSDGVYFRIDGLEKVEDKHILTFEKARGVLTKLVDSVEGKCPKDKNPFVAASREALAALQKNPQDPRWVQVSADPLIDQFKLERKELAIQRTAKENWMKEQAFLMLPDLWSPIHVADDGQIVFFYLQEKKLNQGPILDQLNFGKETLAADAQRYVAEKMLHTVKIKNAIVIPVQSEDE